MSMGVDVMYLIAGLEYLVLLQLCHVPDWQESFIPDLVGYVWDENGPPISRLLSHCKKMCRGTLLVSAACFLNSNEFLWDTDSGAPSRPASLRALSIGVTDKSLPCFPPQNCG